MLRHNGEKDRRAWCCQKRKFFEGGEVNCEMLVRKHKRVAWAWPLASLMMLIGESVKL